MDNRIKKARSEKGWSQADLSRRMFVSQPSVAAWESGRKAPHTKNLARLAMLLEVSVEWLTTGRGDKNTVSTLATQETSADWMLPEERRLLDYFGNLKPHQRTTLLGFLESLNS
ncbi:MAG: helix-turn-helix transcriptional regulator [Gallionellaceae bacterium]